MFLIYKVLHIAGIAAVVAGLAALAFHRIGGGTKEDAGHKALAFATHGSGLIILLVTGFGMVARLDAGMTSVWVLAKIGLWLLAGALIALPLRSAGLAKATWAGVLTLVAVAAFFAIHKPGG